MQTDDCDKISMENSEELRTSKDSDKKSLPTAPLD